MVGIHFGATNFRHAVAARVKPLAGAHLHTHMHPPNLISALVLFGTNIIFLPASGNYARCCATSPAQPGRPGRPPPPSPSRTCTSAWAGGWFCLQQLSTQGPSAC